MRCIVFCLIYTDPGSGGGSCSIVHSQRKPKIKISSSELNGKRKFGVWINLWAVHTLGHTLGYTEFVIIIILKSSKTFSLSLVLYSNLMCVRKSSTHLILIINAQFVFLSRMQKLMTCPTRQLEIVTSTQRFIQIIQSQNEVSIKRENVNEKTIPWEKCGKFCSTK